MSSKTLVTLPDYLVALELPCYPELEYVMAYGGDMRYVAFVESNQGLLDPFGLVVWIDGHWRNSANAWAFYLWAAHPKTRGVIGDIEKTDSKTGLLLDRVERKLYLFNAYHERDIDPWLEVNNTPLNNPYPISWGDIAQAQTKAREFLVWMGKN